MTNEELAKKGAKKVVQHIFAHQAKCDYTDLELKELIETNSDTILSLLNEATVNTVPNDFVDGALKCDKKADEIIARLRSRIKELEGMLQSAQSSFDEAAEYLHRYLSDAHDEDTEPEELNELYSRLSKAMDAAAEYFEKEKKKIGG